MPGVLYDKIVYGPVSSRRFGVSLGINVLPEDTKLCSFDCIYCEAGWNNVKTNGHSKQLFHKRNDIIKSLENRLSDLKERYLIPESITFSGNGEPTMHPEFSALVKDVKNVRDLYVPDTPVTVLSNSTTLNNDKIFNTLANIENNVMKLDAGTDDLFQIINQPVGKINLNDIVSNLKKFHGNLFIQSMFLKGIHRGIEIDNTSEHEINQWLSHINAINPKGVLLYSIDRPTPNHTLTKIPYATLEEIAEKVRAMGIDATSYS